MDGNARKKSLLDAGAKLAAKHGAVNVTRKMVAEAVDSAPALVSHYLGPTAEAQKAYRRHMKKLGLSEPSKDKIEEIGVKLRAHGPRKKPVVRSVKKRAVAPAKAAETLRKPRKVVNVPPPVAPLPAKKTAARKPLAPPVSPGGDLPL